MDTNTTQAVTEAVATILKANNIMGSDKDISDIIANALAKEHRTIQCSFVKIINNVLVQYSKTEYYDMRNESAVEYAKKVAKLEAYFPFV